MAAEGSLTEYHRKRRFDRSPEPAGRVAPATGKELSFVVQKHAATRLHYDFRLELGGVLKSWAVPKGPSLDPGERRLAVATEDHPLDYGDFEGVIPADEYGGGTVLLWDRGRWTPEGGPTAAAKAWAEGKLKFRLEGEKLAGGWVLVRMSGPRSDDGRNWLLIKEKDDAARPGSGSRVVEERPESVASGRGLEAIAAAPEGVWHSSEAAAATEDASPEVDPGSLPGARRAKLAKRVPKPQLATLADRAPDGDRWLHEIKHDGYRVLARIERRDGTADVRLVTRNGHDWTDRFGSIAGAAGRLAVTSALVDGEVVALTAEGTSSFAALQRALGTRAARTAGGGGDGAGDAAGGVLVYQAFDLLHLDGYDLTAAPLGERKELLAGVLARSGSDPTTTLRFSDHVAGRGQEFFRQACRFALEGVVSKRRDVPYRPGRGRDWLKVKCSLRQELVIGGFTEPSGSRSGFGSLLLGVHAGEGGGEAGLIYAGRVGTGFDAATLRDLRRRLDALETAEPPFADPRAAAAGGSRRAVHWVEPELVCEVEFTEWTRDGVLRHPSFQGLREDKDPAEVVRETPEPTAAAAEGAGDAAPRAEPEEPAEAGEEAEMKERTRRRGASRGANEIAGIRISSPDRVVYPRQGVTKRQLAEYYVAIADHMLPHVAGRPLTLVRCPQGEGENCFYHKHIDKSFPAAVHRIEVEEKEGELATYAVVDSLPGLVAMVQMGVLELHVWGSRRDRIERPDLLVFDLDPDEGLAWERVVEGALAVRGVLTELGLDSFLKTTGGKGLHVVVPIVRRLDWDEAKDFTHAVADHIVAAAPERFLATMSKAKRKGKVFIDYLRNGRGATFIAPFSARARPGATVSMPVSWQEVAEVDAAAFDVTSVPRLLAARQADPWRELPAVRQSVTKAMWRRLGGG